MRVNQGCDLEMNLVVNLYQVWAISEMDVGKTRVSPNYKDQNASPLTVQRSQLSLEYESLIPQWAKSVRLIFLHNYGKRV